MLVWSERLTGSRGTVVRALTGRAGGVSTGPYAALNLGDHVGDDAAAVAENRRRVAAAAGGSLVVARQVHGRGVAVVDAPWAGAPAEADALVTDRPQLLLAVLVADCVP
ncbi:MAG: laccase domain-containing protein, partial [Actinomycetota bacterium]